MLTLNALTEALDVTIQAQILELLRELQREKGMAILMITHDLGVVAENADHVVVMYAGKVVESAPVEELFENPKHPYTVGLFRSLPRLEQENDRLEVIEGNVPNPLQFPSGCKFRPRCPHASETCAATEPELAHAGDQHQVSCHHWEEVFKASGNGAV